MPDALTDAELEAIEARANAATEGPWESDREYGAFPERRDKPGKCDWCRSYGPPVRVEENAGFGPKIKAHIHREKQEAATVYTVDGRAIIDLEWLDYNNAGLTFKSDDRLFIAQARTDIPRLVAEVRRLRAAMNQCRQDGRCDVALRTERDDWDAGMYR